MNNSVTYPIDPLLKKTIKREAALFAIGYRFYRLTRYAHAADKKIPEGGLAMMLQQTIETAIKDKTVTPSQVTRQIQSTAALIAYDYSLSPQLPATHKLPQLVGGKKLLDISLYFHFKKGKKSADNIMKDLKKLKRPAASFEVWKKGVEEFLDDFAVRNKPYTELHEEFEALDRNFDNCFKILSKDHIDLAQLEFMRNVHGHAVEFRIKNFDRGEKYLLKQERTKAVYAVLDHLPQTQKELEPFLKRAIQTVSEKTHPLAAKAIYRDTPGNLYTNIAQRLLVRN
jgi:hypothetical protein